jgi:hypothetical protein
MPRGCGSLEERGLQALWLATKDGCVPPPLAASESNAFEVRFPTP